MGQKITQHVKISDEMLKKIERVGDASCRHHVQFTPEQDEVIRQYYMKKNKKELAKAMGMCYNTLRQRYNELVKNGEA